MATEAAWLEGKEFQEKKKNQLDSTGLLMEGLGKSLHDLFKPKCFRQEFDAKAVWQLRPSRNWIASSGRAATSLSRGIDPDFSSDHFLETSHATLHPGLLSSCFCCRTVPVRGGQLSIEFFIFLGNTDNGRR